MDFSSPHPLNNLYSQYPNLNALKSFSETAEISINLLRKYMAYDAGHDEAHIYRVVMNALWFAEPYPDADQEIVVVAALLHDLINVPKDSKDRKWASRRSADKVTELLSSHGVERSDDFFTGVHHAIAAHSWSAGIEPTTIEAKIVQDADRVDSLGFLGIARLFSVGGKMCREMFDQWDPHAEFRDKDELKYTLDHFYVKLDKIEAGMHTKWGKHLAKTRTSKMKAFIGEMISESVGLEYIAR